MQPKPRVMPTLLGAFAMRKKYGKNAPLVVKLEYRNQIKQENQMKKKTPCNRQLERFFANKKYRKYKEASSSSIQRALALGTDRR